MEKEIVFIDGRSEMSKLLSHTLGKAFSIKWFKTASNALQQLDNSSAHDLVIGTYDDYVKSPSNYIEISTKSVHGRIPLVIINSNHGNIKSELIDQIECLIPKPINSTDLSLKVLEIIKKYDLANQID